jgi:hypothetical protein
MPLLWGIIVDAGVWLFRSRIGLFIMSALAWLGINYGTVKIVLDPTIALINGYLDNMHGGAAGSVSQAMWQWVGVLHFDRALTMIISAYVTKTSISNLRLRWFKAGTGGGGGG